MILHHLEMPLNAECSQTWLKVLIALDLWPELCPIEPIIQTCMGQH